MRQNPMPKQIPSDLLDRVVALLERQPAGLSLAELEESLAGIASRRSLQRRLDEWTRGRAITAKGIRRGRRYFSPARPPGSALTTPPAGSLTISAEPPRLIEGIPLSTAAQQIHAFINRPIADREPVGFRREFLESYIANTTSYLSDSLKSHLRELGRTPDGRRPAGTYAREILTRLLVDLSWSSSRLEGNTYSLIDTRELIERGTPASNKDAKETQMILNHKAAIELLVDATEEVGINRYTILNLHALLADNLLEDPRNSGRLRVAAVGIAASTYLPTANPQLIEEMFARMLDIAAAIRDPFEQSFYLLVHLPYLQPFVDVNKRTSRLACNIPLIRENLVPLSFIDVPERSYIDGLIGIYEQNRIELLRDVYLWAYERSARHYKTVRDSLPEPDPFRLRYRNALIEAVATVVRRKLPMTEKTISRLAHTLVESRDVPAFTRLVAAELQGLHEGNIARFRLLPSEFRRWQSG